MDPKVKKTRNPRSLQVSPYVKAFIERDANPECCKNACKHKQFGNSLCFCLDSAFKQQRLTAWQPILTAGTVLPTFFVIGILFIPVGIGLWFFSENVREVTVPYTNCLSIGDEKNRTCSEIIRNGSSDSLCQCEVFFELDTQFSVSFQLKIIWLHRISINVNGSFLYFSLECSCTMH